RRGDDHRCPASDDAVAPAAHGNRGPDEVRKQHAADHRDEHGRRQPEEREPEHAMADVTVHFDRPESVGGADDPAGDRTLAHDHEAAVYGSPHVRLASTIVADLAIASAMSSASR